MKKTSKIYLLIAFPIFIVFIALILTKPSVKRSSTSISSKKDPRALTEIIKAAPLTTYTGTMQSVEKYMAGLKWYLKQRGFYESSSRQQKVIATNTMVKLEGWDYEDVEQKGNGITVFSSMYLKKNLAYQLGISYDKEGLMELITFQIIFADPNTGKPLMIKKIK